MKLRNVDVYVTGSNAKFLSKDVITEFRGRGWEIRIHPLSFAEFYDYQGGATSMRHSVCTAGMVETWELVDGKRVRKNLEVDFVVNRAPKRWYIQSAFALPTREKTLQEQRSLMKIPEGRESLLCGENIVIL